MASLPLLPPSMPTQLFVRCVYVLPHRIIITTTYIWKDIMILKTLDIDLIPHAFSSHTFAYELKLNGMCSHSLAELHLLNPWPLHAQEKAWCVVYMPLVLCCRNSCIANWIAGFCCVMYFLLHSSVCWMFGTFVYRFLRRSWRLEKACLAFTHYVPSSFLHINYIAWQKTHYVIDDPMSFNILNLLSWGTHHLV